MTNDYIERFIYVTLQILKVKSFCVNRSGLSIHNPVINFDRFNKEVKELDFSNTFVKISNTLFKFCF